MTSKSGPMSCVGFRRVASESKHEDMTDVVGKLKKPEISPEVYDIEFELPGSDYQKLTIPNVDIEAGEHQKETEPSPSQKTTRSVGCPVASRPLEYAQL